MRGTSPHCTPGARRRRGPIDENGLARSDQIGSVKMWAPLCCISSVEWLINVTRNWPSSTHDGGCDGMTSETNGADLSGRLVNFHRRTSTNPRA